MGWKLSSIIIKNPGNVSDEILIRKLFNMESERLEDTTFEECMFPEDDPTIYLSNYKNCLIITTGNPRSMGKFFTDKISTTDQKFIDLFPTSEIGAFVLHSTVNYSAWTIINNGKKIRTKSCDGDNGTTIDFGEPLEEELEYLKYSFIDKKGRRRYNWPSKKGDALITNVMTEDQVGESFVDKIWARFTGINLFDDDDLHFETPFRVYKIILSKEYLDSITPQPLWKRLFGKK